MRRERGFRGSLLRALERDEFFLEYLPTVDLVTGRCLGAEALIRWNSPELGRMPPESFIRPAEQLDLMPQITEWVMRRVGRDIERLLEADPTLRVSLNLAPEDILDPAFVDRAKRLLGAHIDHIEFELTERGSLHHPSEKIRARLADLRALGAHISLDDFGVGNSNLAYLLHFEVDSLKIDRVFLPDSRLPGIGTELIEAIISIGKRLGIRLVAEGVEELEQADFLRARGITAVQGFLFSRPLSIAAFVEFLAAKKALLGEQAAE